MKTIWMIWTVTTQNLPFVLQILYVCVSRSVYLIEQGSMHAYYWGSPEATAIYTKVPAAWTKKNFKITNDLNFRYERKKL